MAEIDEAWTIVQSKLRKFAEAIDEFRTIKVRTTLSDFEVITEEDHDGGKRVVDLQIDAAGQNKVRGLVTRIDMLQGDIVHGQSPGLSENEEARLREVHAQHVALGQKIFADNIRFLADTVERFARRRGDEG